MIARPLYGESYPDEAVRLARVALEAALVSSDREEVRKAWRLYHELLAWVLPPGSDEAGEAGRLLDLAFGLAADKQVIRAKRDYDRAVLAALQRSPLRMGPDRRSQT